MPPWAAGAVLVAVLVVYAVVNRLAHHARPVHVVTFTAVTTLLLVVAGRLFPRHDPGPHQERLALYRACAAFWAAGVVWNVITLDADRVPWGLGDPWSGVALFAPAYALLCGYGVAQALIGGVWQGLDAVVAVLAGASAAYVTFLRPFVDTGEGLTPGAVRVMADVVLIAVVVAALIVVRRDAALWLLLAATVVGLVAGQLHGARTVTGTYNPGDLVDVLRLLHYALMVASLAPPVPEPVLAQGIGARRSRIVLLGLGTLIPPVVLAGLAFAPGGERDGGIGVLAVATVVVTALVTVRLTALTFTHERLATRLSRMLRDREQMQETLERQVMFDTLTGLANRYAFCKATEEVAGRSVGCVMFIDLDDFKLVNDTRGHQAGDDLLIELAGRIRQAVRGDDLVARLGGDEFAVLLPGSSVDSARLRATRIIESLMRDVHLPDGGSAVRVGASIGVAELTDDPDKSLASADLAMYAAKQAGKGTVAVFDKGMRESLQGEARFASDFETALAHGDLECAFQPIVDLTDPGYIAFEALVRWNRDGRSVPPDVFLPVAAQRGLAPAVDMLMLHKALNAVQLWRLEGFEVIVHVNVSAQLALRPDFTDLVRDTLLRYNVPDSRLVLEMTEHAVIDDTAAVAGKLRSLQEGGVRVALDDFGTGYSSLAYLQELPVDILKLDKALVRRGTAQRESSDLLKSIIDIGHSLRMQVTAEGIETPHQEAVVISLGCDFGQGWLWGAAMDHHQAQQYLIRTHTGRLMERFHSPYSGAVAG
ncbi:MAG: diguanylate cyclase [Actinomycetota bacterium]|nr:diguanylate cyclase [Actinomycetota bacterium]